MTDSDTAPGPAVDLNSDLGESFGRWVLGDDAAMLDVVTSANVACGFHAGDPSTILRTVEQAVHAGVVVGAQVSYRDLAGFGRRFVDMAYGDLVADVLYQISAVAGLVASCGDRLRYVKPHGALYNTIVHHEPQAAAVVEAVRRYDPGLPVLGLPGSAFLSQAEKDGLPVVREAFADRAYTPGGTLMPRSEPGAVLGDPDEVAARVLGLVRAGSLTAADGTSIPVDAESICVHGDSPAAVAMAQAIRDRLAQGGVTLRSFA